MDQVKVVLAVLKKHHFWVLCGVSVILAMGVWWSATSGLADKIDGRKKELEGVHSSVQGISSGGTHPNENCIAAVGTLHTELTGNVFQTWEDQYLAQKERNRWPIELGDEVRRHIEFLDPDAEIPDYYRDTYMYFIKNHLPELGKIVDVRLPAKRDENGEILRDAEGKPVKIDPFEGAVGASRMPRGGSMMGDYGGSEEGSGGMPGMGGYATTTRAGGDDLVGKVIWSKGDQSRIRDGLFWATRPTTLDVRLAQEDLWIYKAILRIIAKTNESATSYYNAPVKRIDALEIGRLAGAAFAKSRGRATGGGGGYPGASMGGEPGMMGSGMGGSMDPMGGMGGMGSADGSMGGEEEYAGAMGGSGGMGMPAGRGAASGSREDMLNDRLLGYRYVDQNGTPLGATDPEPFAEFKMMPIRMLLLVDQRRVSRLLVNCANSPMPVEVRQVTLNAGSDGALNLRQTGGGSGPGGPMMGAMGGLGSQYGGGAGSEEEGAFGGSGSGPGQMTQGRGKQHSYDVPVEVLGIIYIFKRPDKAKLGTGAGAAPLADTPPVELATPPAGPATTPPAGPATTPPAGPATTPPAGPAATPPAGPATTPPAGPAATPPAGPAAAPPAGPAMAPPAGPATTPPAGPATTPPAAAPAATTPATPPVAGGGIRKRKETDRK